MPPNRSFTPSGFTSPSVSIQQAVIRVLQREALRNERWVAYVRAGVLTVSACLDTLVFFFPQTLLGQAAVPPTVALIGCLGAVGAVAIAALLNHPWGIHRLPQLQLWVPLFDGLLLSLFITNIWYVLGQVQPQIVINITAFCCLMALTGAIRLQRRASLITTLFALLNFAYAALRFQLNPAIAVFTGITITAIGALGFLMGQLVRRQVNNEAGRALMTRFLPEQLVDAAFETPLALMQQPRNCEVTVIFCDLRGFTQYSEKLSPAEVLSFLSQFQGHLSKIVEQHGGSVISFMGDGMMAVFGAPQPLPNHADQALRAAQTMLQSIDQVCPLAMGIGLHTGLVVAGCLGTEGHLEFSVIGDTVNIASRIEALTKQMGQPLLISATTQQQLTATGLRALGPYSIRGRSAQLELYTLPDASSPHPSGLRS
ncbi:MAG: adenylate/guanylate cyclase domain-containing protein [Cyanobacteria bacterium P01_A01_bin.105]